MLSTVWTWAIWVYELCIELPSFLEYRYEPLKGHREIRLVRINPRASVDAILQCSLETVSLDVVPSYTALSYTWGSPFSDESKDQPLTSPQIKFEAFAKTRSEHKTLTRDQHVPNFTRILLNGRSIYVTRNLADALYQFSEMRSNHLFWIDAMCINQASVFERNSQVSMMGEIYASARAVLVWLGEEDWNSMLVHAFLKTLPGVQAQIKSTGVQFDRDHPLSWQPPEAGFNCFYDADSQSTEGMHDRVLGFYARKWFTRVWTLQEVLLAREVEVYCGNAKISWNQLRDLLRFLELTDWTSALTQYRKAGSQHSDSMPQDGPSALIQQRIQLLEHETIETIKARMAQESKHGRARAVEYLMEFLDQLIYHSRLRDATDPRDHIFGLFGITQILCDAAKMENPLPRPDYSKETCTVFTESFKAVIEQSASLRVLSSVEDASVRNRIDLPSWVPDLTTRGSVGFTSLKNADAYNASRQQPMAMFPTEYRGVISLAGYHVDTVVEFGDDDISLAGHGDHEPFEQTSRMLLNLPTNIYMNGQDRVEVLWRALIADQARGQSPAPVFIGNAFHQHLLMHLSTYILSTRGLQTDDAQGMISKIAPIVHLSLSSTISTTLIPSITEIVARCRVYHSLEAARTAKSPATTALRDVWDSVLREEQKAAPFTREAATVFTARRIFRTRDNLIGIGPRSLQVDDCIFILPGANVPFLLRKRADGTYKLVGEAYVHGIMHGEALDRDDLGLERLDLV